ncbi:lytic transglycosylase domain-containing protein [Aliirhizobium smilacinae]|uniref:Lytic transglycosylase domain-containing protein n=1 Tax=Aliirhizobium smilacinae TaxID=1395944 RepID=A0A5C4XGE8_9HYPH|nr:lytic transglycosylase domain-containing protein [Rhizobium smilacinae]TNM62269.1 lytic transglycosylase domain-containing protein [Rhizobium smilacinae]
MRMLAVAAAVSMAVLAAGTNFVRAEDGGDTTSTDKRAIEPWETRETAAQAATPEEQLVLRQARYEGLIRQYADQYDVPAELAMAVVRIESNFRPTVRGSAGEIGLMQIKPATAKLMGYKGRASGLYDPETNIRYGMKYLAKARDLGDGKLCRTILKYNAGHGAKRMNPVSQSYCNKVETVIASMEREKPVEAISYATVALDYGRTYPLMF